MSKTTNNAAAKNADDDAGESRLTLVELARRLGLAKSTVSEALSGRGNVSQKTRERVKKAALDWGYRPDPIMSAFSRHRRLQVPEDAGMLAAVSQHANNKNAALAKMQRLAKKLGYVLDGFSLADYPSQKALARVLEARGVVGVVFIEDTPATVLEPGLWDRFRCVYCGPYPAGGDKNCPVDIVRHNPFDAVTLAWEKAVAAGCRRIGLIMPLHEPKLNVIEEKSLASFLYRQQTEDPPLPKMEPLCLPFSRMQEQPGLLTKWIEDQQPDVVLGGFRAVLGLLLREGHRMPEDFGFIALRVREVYKDTAGCRMNSSDVGEMALQQLHAIIQHTEPVALEHTTTLVINPIWQDGESFPC